MLFFKKKLSIDLKNLGVIPDPRSDAEKSKDYQSEEILEFVPFEWKEKFESDWRKYPIFDQDGSSSCLANATTKVLGVENVLEEGKFVFYSPRDIYSRRSNYPGKGMYFQEALEIGYKYGATLEQLMPSMGLGEDAMNNSSDRKSIDQQIASIGKGGNYLTLPIDIDKIASIIEPAGKAVLLGVRFGPGEWGREVPLINPNNNFWYGHGIAGTIATLYKGKKAIVIEDSCGINSGIQGRRVVTEEWFTSGRIIFAGHYLPLKNTWKDTTTSFPRPKYKFTKNLSIGMYDYDIERLQEILKFEELFPQVKITTGIYGPLTALGVYGFQKKYSVGNPADIEVLQGKNVGPLTIVKLNELYS